MNNLWICLVVTCLSEVSGFLNIDCNRQHDSQWIQNYCKYHNSNNNQHSGHTHSNTDSFGCNNVYEKDRVNLIWNDWHKNGDDKVVKQLYLDLLVSLQAGSSSSLPGKREITKRRPVHDEAYYHHDTVPDYPHVRDLVYNHMNEKCRVEIIQKLEQDLHFSQTTPSTTTLQHHTNAPTTKATTHVQRLTTQQTQKPTTMKPSTAKPTTMKPSTAKPTTMMPSTAQPTTMKPSTKQPTTMAGSTDVLTTLPQMINTSYSCNLLRFVTALAHSDKISNQNAGICTDGSHTESEALVMDLCNVPVTSKWAKGVNVGTNCKNIPPYTPIATFVFDSYVQSSSELSGILVECTADGFKAAFQLCGNPSKIYDLKHGTADRRQDAYSYYVVN